MVHILFSRGVFIALTLFLFEGGLAQGSTEARGFSFDANSVETIRILGPNVKLTVEEAPGAEAIQVRWVGPEGAPRSPVGTISDRVLTLNPFMGGDSSESMTLQVRSPSKTMEVFIGDGEVSVLNWKASLSLSGRTVKFVAQQTQGEMRIQVHGGELSASKHKGALILDSYDGRVKLSGLESDVQVTNFAGPTDVEHLKGSMSLDSYSGRVQIAHSEASLQMRGAQAPINISDHRGGAIEGKLQGGTLTIESSDPNPSIEVESTTGLLQVRVLSNAGARIYASSTQGSLYVPQFLTTQQTAKGRVAWGRLRGESGGRIHLKSDTGDIRIR